MSTFVIVPGAWDTPAVMDPLVALLEAVDHGVIVVDLPCDDPDATLLFRTGSAEAAVARPVTA
jgi:hypothetical protein